MRAKLLKYGQGHPRGRWPLAANILDPVRATVVCEGAQQILEIVEWFGTAKKSGVLGIKICRIKNRFTASDVNLNRDSHRHIGLNVRFADCEGLQIIGEIQVNDTDLHNLHKQVKMKHHGFNTHLDL